MKADRLLTVLVVVLFAAAAVVFLMKRGSPEAPPPAAMAEPEPDSLELLVVGIEGLEISVIEEAIAEGRLPHLAGLMERGATVEFDDLDRETGGTLSWACLASGAVPVPRPPGWTKEASPEDHDPLAFRPTPLWSVITEAGEPVSVVGWPGTWPAVEVSGIMVGPYGPYVMAREHGDDRTHGVRPVSELPRIDPLMMPWRNVPRVTLARFFDTEGPLGYEALAGRNYDVLQKAVTGDLSMLGVSRYAAARFGGHLFVYLPGLSEASERFWLYWDPDLRSTALEYVGDADYFSRMAEGLSTTVDDYYDFVDEGVGVLLGWVEDGGTVAVVSDHGYSGFEIRHGGEPALGVETHSERGLCLLAGPGVRERVRVRDASIRDVAPTIAAAAGLPAPPDAEGESLPSVLTTPRGSED